jgi:hypothetical protein
VEFDTINILDMINAYGEEDVRKRISEFSCPINPEIEHFVFENAVEFAKKKMSITHFAINSKGKIVALFTLTHKSIEIGNRDFSKSKIRKLSRYAAINTETEGYRTSAFLIAQFGKNYAVEDGRSISGNELMELTFEILKKVQHEVGGGIVYLECEDKPELLGFYQNEHNGFIRFGERYSEEDNKKYIQLFNFL